MVQESVTGIMKLLKQTTELDATIAMDIYEVLAARLKKHHVDTIMSLIQFQGGDGKLKHQAEEQTP